MSYILVSIQFQIFFNFPYNLFFNSSITNLCVKFQMLLSDIFLFDLELNSTVVRKHTLYDFNTYKFIESYFMIHMFSLASMCTWKV